MKADIIGYRRIDISDSNVHGYTVYITYPDEGIEGLKAERVFLNDGIINRDQKGKVPCDGMVIDLDFNTRGKVAGIRALDLG